MPLTGHTPDWEGPANAPHYVVPQIVQVAAAWHPLMGALLVTCKVGELVFTLQRPAVAVLVVFEGVRAPT